MWIPLGGGLPLEERQVWTGLQHRSLDHPVGNDSPQLLRSRSVFRFLFTLDRHPCLCHHQRKSRRGCHLAVRVCHPLLCRIRTVCVGFPIYPSALCGILMCSGLRVESPVTNHFLPSTKRY